MDTEPWPEEQVAPFPSASIRHGILWNTAGQVASRILNLLFILVLARLLTPRDFGLVAIGTAIIAFATVLTDIGVGSALVQRQHDIRDNASAAFYMNALAVLLLGGSLLLLSGPIARFYGQPAVSRVLPLLIAAFLVRGLMATHEAYLRKRMLFRRLQLINVSSVAAYGGLAVLLAWLGAGVWSLAWGVLLGACVYASLVLAGSGMPLSLNPHFRRWRDLFAFGRWVFLGGMLTWVLQSGDNLAVGKFLGPSALGVYSIAYGYGLLPAALVGGAVAQALFPAYARLQGDLDQLRTLVSRIVRLSAAVCFPMAGAFLFAAGDVLVALMGPKWTRVGPPFHVFAVVFSAALFTASFPRVYDAVDRPIVNVYIALAALPVMIAGTVIGLNFGVFGVSLGIAAMLIEMVLLQVFALSTTIGLSMRGIADDVWPPAACVGLGVAAGTVPFLLLRADLPRLAGDAIACVVMSAVYVLAMGRFFPSVWSEAVAQAHAVLGRPRTRG
jgi:O-antigen/teichoic acid export membrane protein